jgi:hypothetical protein
VDDAYFMTAQAEQFGQAVRGIHVVVVDEHRAIDLIIERAVRTHPQGKPPALIVLDLVFARRERVDDGQQKGFQIGTGHVDPHIANGAPDITQCRQTRRPPRLESRGHPRENAFPRTSPRPVCRVVGAGSV